jgi:hypothetical protein
MAQSDWNSKSVCINGVSSIGADRAAHCRAQQVKPGVRKAKFRRAIEALRSPRATGYANLLAPDRAPLAAFPKVAMSDWTSRGSPMSAIPMNIAIVSPAGGDLR